MPKELPVGWRLPTSLTVAQHEYGLKNGLVPAGHRVLREQAVIVPPDEIPKLQAIRIVQRMFAVVQAMERAKRPLIGLAAPQIGERAQIILVPKEERDSDTTYGKFMAVFNPSVSVRKADKIVPHGCFSANEIFVRLLSATDATLTGFDRHGEPLRLHRAGINATVDEHEVRHLRGMRAADIAIRDGSQLDWRPPEHAEAYRQYADGHRGSRSWPEWQDAYPYAQWQAVKAGKFLIERYK